MIYTDTKGNIKCSKCNVEDIAFTHWNETDLFYDEQVGHNRLAWVDMDGFFVQWVV